jgi:hypothetical protein
LRRSLRKRRTSSSLSEDSTEAAPVQEELEEASRKLIRLTRCILALKNRPSTTMPSSPKWTNIRKRRIALYKLCRELQRTCSSDSRVRSDSDHASFRTSSSGQSSTFDPRLWRPSVTAGNHPSSLPRSKDRSLLVDSQRLPPPAHEDEALTTLAEGFRRQLRFPSSDPPALDLSSRQQPPQ